MTPTPKCPKCGGERLSQRRKEICWTRVETWRRDDLGLLAPDDLGRDELEDSYPTGEYGCCDCTWTGTLADLEGDYL